MSKNRYLQRLGHSWDIRIKVPTSLRGTIKSTHIRRALHNRDLDEATRRKWAAVAQVHAYLQAQASNPGHDVCLAIPAPTATTPVAPLPCPQDDLHNLRPSMGLDSLSEE